MFRELAKKYAPKTYKPKTYHPKQYKPKKPKKYVKGEIMLKELIMLADILDSKGFYVEANELDLIVAEQRRIFQEEEGVETGLSTEQDPTRYDVGRVPDSKTPGKDPDEYRDPRVIEAPDGTLRCRDCGTVIPIEEDQLGCSVCEEEKNLGFLKTPDGTLHPPRLKNPPRIYDRYREELPEDVEMQTGFIREKKEQRLNNDLYPHSGGEPY